MSDSPKEHCGVFGIYGHPDASQLTYLGLYALQHRGEESAGIASRHEGRIYSYKDMGLVNDVFNEETLQKLPGHSAIGHVRYSTTGSSQLHNAQPLVVDYSRGSVAIAHNGNLINALVLRDELEAYGSIFQTTLDSEIIVHLMAKPTYRTQEEGLVESVRRIEGAYALVLLTEQSLIGVRDPHGWRPLVIGKLDDAYILASETCALDLLNAKLVREVEPGEMVVIDEQGLRSVRIFSDEEVTRSHCIFEHVYFARPDSYVFGQNVHEVRKALGQQLAREHPVDADIVMPVPDSGNSAALGYSLESGLPLEFGFIRNHYVGRTFIQPTQDAREFKVKIKFNPLREVLKGKRVVVVDDSIVRGTTCRARVKSLRDAGAKEIHMRVSCPPIKHPCFYGIDFPRTDRLIGAKHSVEEIRGFINADSLGYLSLDGLLSAVDGGKTNYCTACYSGDYPVDFGGSGDKYAFEKRFVGSTGEKRLMAIHGASHSAKVEQHGG